MFFKNLLHSCALDESSLSIGRARKYFMYGVLLPLENNSLSNYNMSQRISIVSDVKDWPNHHGCDQLIKSQTCHPMKMEH